MSADVPGSSRASRRQFLGRVGAGAVGAIAASATPVGIATSTGTAGAVDAPRQGQPPVDGRFFGRMFDLPPFAPETEEVRAALLEIGKPGGMLDADDDLAAGPIALIVDPAKRTGNPDNPHNTAGVTFVGQFLDHDATFDETSTLGSATSPHTSPNTRTPAFDLDSVYGSGPVSRPELYDGPRLRIEANGPVEDVPRRPDGRAILGDPRNDENIVLSGLQAAFISFHNNAVDHVRSLDRRAGDATALLEARRLTTWHYQWLIVNELLPAFVGQPLVDRIRREGRRAFRPTTAYVPVEWSGAAYRMGHSMIRPSYRVNFTGDPNGPRLAGQRGGQKGGQFFGLVFDDTIPDGTPDRADLLGGSRAPRRYVGWSTFFDFGDGFVRQNKLVDTKLSSPLFRLPLPTIAGNTGPGDVQSLSQRTLLRHLTWQLPSGQSIARELGVDPLRPGDLQDLRDVHLPFGNHTPLFLYILREAELATGGHHLGPVGGRIVAEVFLALLELDPRSYLSQEPTWRPHLGAVGHTGRYDMTSFLRFAGVAGIR